MNDRVVNLEGGFDRVSTLWIVHAKCEAWHDFEIMLNFVLGRRYIKAVDSSRDSLNDLVQSIRWVPGLFEERKL